MWKQNIKIGIVNNQNFVQIPFLKLLNQIQYKSDLAGIAVIKEKESFTSKCSFLDGEPVRRRERYAGKKIYKRSFQNKIRSYYKR